VIAPKRVIGHHMATRRRRQAVKLAGGVASDVFIAVLTVLYLAQSLYNDSIDITNFY
jgi:hypothetical protein